MGIKEKDSEILKDDVFLQEAALYYLFDSDLEYLDDIDLHDIILQYKYDKGLLDPEDDESEAWDENDDDYKPKP